MAGSSQAALLRYLVGVPVALFSNFLYLGSPEVGEWGSAPRPVLGLLFAGFILLLMFCAYALLEGLKGQRVLKWVMAIVLFLGAFHLLGGLLLLFFVLSGDVSPDEGMFHRSALIVWRISYGTLSIAGLLALDRWPRIWPRARAFLGSQPPPTRSE
jgi:hypothetical protein